MTEIRRPTESDANTLSELGKRTFIETFANDNSKEDMDLYIAKTFGAEIQLREIQDQNRLIEIAWVENVATGFFHLAKNRPNPSVLGAKPIELLRLYVDSRCIGKGIGAALMDRVIEVARSNGFQTLWLGVWERNFRAQAFYKKYGFATVGQHIFKLGDDDQVDLIMTRTI